MRLQTLMAVVLVGAGCQTSTTGTTSSSQSCIPGQQVSCACGQGMRGYQVCNADGSALGPCEACAPSQGSSSSSGGSAASDFTGTADGVITLVPSVMTLVEGAQLTLEVHAYDGAGQPTAAPQLTVRDPAVATLAGMRLTAVAAGATRLEVTDVQGTRMVGFVTVLPPATVPDATTPFSISVSPPSLSLLPNGTASFTARVFAETGAELATPVTWVAQDTSVATIAAGVVTGVGNGVTPVVVRAGSVSAGAVVTVSNPTQPGGTVPSGLPANCIPDTFIAAGLLAPPSPMAVELWPDGRAYKALGTATYGCPTRIMTTNEGIWSVAGGAGLHVDATGAVSADACASGTVRWQPPGSSPSQDYSFSVYVRPKWAGSWTCTWIDSCSSVYSGVFQAFVENPRLIPGTMPISERQDEYRIVSMTRRDFASGDGCGCFDACCTSLPGSLAPGARWTVGLADNCSLDSVDQAFTCTRGGGGMCPMSPVGPADAGVGNVDGGGGVVCGRISVNTDVPCSFWSGSCSDLPILTACCDRGVLDEAISRCQVAHGACVGNEQTVVCDARFKSCIDGTCPGGSAEFEF